MNNVKNLTQFTTLISIQCDYFTYFWNPIVPYAVVDLVLCNSLLFSGISQLGGFILLFTIDL